MRQGDVAELRFDAVPDSPPGLVTTLLLRTNLVYKPRVVVGSAGPTSLSEQVEPMPHRDMARYGSDAQPRKDSQYLDYLARWNTRRYERHASEAAA